ncbi:hypothetical protein [Nostoc sp. JL34]|nr:hypothetical protein [Nostoc sp. JL34]
MSKSSNSEPSRFSMASRRSPLASPAQPVPVVRLTDTRVAEVK